MPYEIPFHNDTWRVPDEAIAGNSESDDPVEFNLDPPEGQDIYRLKLFVEAHSMLNMPVTRLSAQQQLSVDSAFKQGRRGFETTITAIRGLSVPMSLAIKRGLVQKDKAQGASFPITNGIEFSVIATHDSVLGVMVAAELLKLASEVDNVDGRFTKLLSGSGIPGMPGATSGNANTAQSAPGSSATAASPGSTAKPPSTTRRRKSGKGTAAPATAR